MISTAIYEILTTNAGVSALLGDKIYPIRTPQTIGEPFLIYMVDERPENTKDKNNLDIIDLDISIFSSQFDNMEAINAATRTALDFYSGTLSGSNIDAIYFEDSRQGFDDNANLFRTDVGYKIRLKK
jgi:hypothetical protein